MNDTKTALVLGASGGIGGEVARHLARDGWRVRALKRGLAPEARGADADGIEWVGGDALDANAVRNAARGCAVIVHAVNPPGYRDWNTLVLPMLENTIAAARAEDALIVLPSGVYNFGPDALPTPAIDSPQAPTTRKGVLRVRMETLLETFTEQGGRALVVRAGDFFGPRPGNNWFSQGLVKPGRPVTRIANPATPGVGHQWTYLPDMAATMAALIARRAVLPAFARYHMAGHWDADGTQMAEAIARVVRCTTGVRPRIAPLRWWLLRLMAPFVTTLRELMEMRYLWRRPVRMDNAALVAVLGSEPHTPLDDAVEATLQGLGCLDAPAPTRSRLRLRFGTIA